MNYHIHPSDPYWDDLGNNQTTKQMDKIPFTRLLRQISGGLRPRLTGARFTPEQYTSIFHAVDSTTNAKNIFKSIAYLREIEARVIEKPDQTVTMEKDIKVDYNPPKQPKICVGDFVKSRRFENILLVLKVLNTRYLVFVVATEGIAPNGPFEVDKEDVEPFTGTIRITQRA